MRSKKTFIIIIIFWIIILGSFISYKQYTLSSGTEIILKTVPVDPKDLFRGDYITLSYEISTIDLTLYQDISTLIPNTSIYVIFDKDEYGYSKVKNLSISRPESGIFIKGDVKSKTGNFIRVIYGIESYFIPEGKGRDIENKRGQGIDAKIMVDKFGNAVLKKILLDSKEIDL